MPGQSEVKIVITAIDKASNTLKQMESGWNNTFKAFGAAVGVVSAVGVALKQVVDETVGYNKQIREMSQVTGLGAEEISRIVQVGDDWGISIEQLRTGLGYMNKQGITPSIEKLAELADEYVRSTDKSKFAEKAAKLLGRGYQTLIPLFAQGGDALRAQTEAIDENLIATEKSIQASRDYEVAVDGLSDAWQGAKMRIGNDAIPVIADALTRLNQEMDEGITLGGLFKQGVDFWKDTLTDADGKMEAAAQAAADLAEGIGPDMQEALRNTGGALVDLAGGASEAAVAAGKMAKGFDLAAQDITTDLQDITSAVLGAEALSALNEAWSSGTLTDMGVYEDYLRAIGTGLLGMTEADVNANIALFETKQAFKDGTDNALPFIGAIFNLDKALQPLPYSTEIAAGEITTLGGNANTARLQMDNAKKSAEGLDGAIDKLHDKDITVTTRFIEIYERKFKDYDPVHGTEGQHGLNMIVPPGHPNDSFPVWASSGERVIVQTKGQQAAGTTVGGAALGNGDIYATFNIFALPNQSPRAIAREALAMLGEAQRFAQAGGGYQGV